VNTDGEVVAMTSDAEPETETGSADPPAEQRYRRLPERIPLKDTTAMQESEASPDPTMGRDTEREFMLRNAGG